MRLVLIIALLFSFRWIIFFNFPLLENDIKWITLGQMLNDSLLIYKDFWDNTPPLVAGLFGLLYKIFGNNPVYYHVFATFLVLFNAVLFNLITSKHRCFVTNNFIPSLIYIFVSSLHVEMLTLSPALLSSTFILFSVNAIFHHTKDRNNEVSILLIGIYLGLAQLCYATSFLFVISTMLFFAAFTGTILRHFLLVLLGFLFPQILIIVFFFLIDSLYPYLELYYSNLIDFDWSFSLTSNLWFLWLVIPSLLAWNSLRIAFRRRHYTSEQLSYQQFIMFWFIISLLSLLLDSNDSTSQLHIAVPFLCYFISIYFINIKRVLFAELIFICFLVAINYLFYIPITKKYFYGFDVSKGFVQNSSLIPFENHKVLNFSNSISVFRNNKVVPPFFNPRITKNVVQNIDDYKNLKLIYESVKKFNPGLIITKNDNLMQSLQNYIPNLMNRYVLIDENELIKVYKLAEIK